MKVRHHAFAHLSALLVMLWTVPALSGGTVQNNRGVPPEQSAKEISSVEGPSTSEANTQFRNNEAALTGGGGAGAGGGTGSGPGLNPQFADLINKGVTTSDTRRTNFQNKYSELNSAKDAIEDIMNMTGVPFIEKLKVRGALANKVDTGEDIPQDQNRPNRSTPGADNNPAGVQPQKGAVPVFNGTYFKPDNLPNSESSSAEVRTPASVYEGAANTQVTEPGQLAHPEWGGGSVSEAVTGMSRGNLEGTNSPHEVTLSDEYLEKLAGTLVSGILNKYGRGNGQKILEAASQRARTPREYIEVLCAYAGEEPDFDPNDRVFFNESHKYQTPEQTLADLKQRVRRISRARFQQIEREEQQKEFRSRVAWFVVYWGTLILFTWLVVFIVGRIWKNIRERKRHDDSIDYPYYVTMGIAISLMTVFGLWKIEIPKKPIVTRLVASIEDDDQGTKRTLASASLPIEMKKSEEEPARYVEMFRKAARDFNEVIGLGSLDGRRKPYVGNDVEIRFGDISDLKGKQRWRLAENGYVAFAYCDIESLRGKKLVLIHKELWDAASPEKREIVIMHELGHCALGREHTDRWLESSAGRRPSSIMHLDGNALSASAYRQNRSEYLRELFMNSR